jgi:RNA polymerase sigma-70 factor (ECF subfamily)
MLGPTENLSELTGGSQRGDPKEFLDRLYRLHYKQLVRYAIAMTRDADAAEDVAQECFVRLLGQAANGHMPDYVDLWLHRVAANLVASGARRRAVAERWEPWLRRDPTDIRSPEDVLVSRERDGHVRGAVDRLPGPARTGLLLAAQGYSGREIARAIRRSEMATRTLLCRARSRMRQNLRLSGIP